MILADQHFGKTEFSRWVVDTSEAQSSSLRRDELQKPLISVRVREARQGLALSHLATGQTNRGPREWVEISKAVEKKCVI